MKKVLDAGNTTALDRPLPVSLGNVTKDTLTARCTCTDEAAQPIRVHFRSGCGGEDYDTAGLDPFDIDLRPGEKARKTIELRAEVRFIKVLVENLDE